MLQITGNEIRLTRGDNAELTIELRDNNGVEYELEADDKITLSVKKYVYSTDYIFQKVSTGTNTIKILPEDTKACEFGKYFYDVQVDTAEGEVYTIIPPSVFVIDKEITV